MKKRILIVAIATVFGWQQVHSQYLHFTNPAGGETFRGYDVVPVQWTSPLGDIVLEEIQVSVDGGLTFPYALGVGYQITDSTWQVLMPNVSSNNCRILFNYYLGGGPYTDTSAPFSITPFPASSLTVNMPADTTLCWYTSFKLTPQISGGQAPYKVVWLDGPAYYANPLRTYCNDCPSYVDSLGFLLPYFQSYTWAVAVTDANGLTGFDSIHVNPHPVAQFNISSSLPQFNAALPCGQTDTLAMTYSGGGQVSSTRWVDQVTGDTIGTGDTLLALPNGGAHNYISYVTDPFGCVTSFDTVYIISLCNTYRVLAGDDCFQLGKPDTTSGSDLVYYLNILANDVFDTTGNRWGFQVITNPTHSEVNGYYQSQYPSGQAPLIQMYISAQDTALADSFQYVLWDVASANYSDTAWVRINVPCPVDSGLVWPGDADNNGYVDNADLLPVGIAYGTQGIARTGASITWTGQYCADWSDSLLAGTNYKYIDCNGDGTINAGDTLAIRQNFSLVHPRGGIQRSDSISPVLALVPFTDTVYNGDTLHAVIELGDSAMPAQNVYGLAFDMQFDPKIVDSNYVQLHFGNSWLGNSSELLSMTWYFAGEGLIRTAVTRTDHNSRSGYGPIGAADFLITTSNINGKDLSYYKAAFNTAGITMLDSAGNPLGVKAGVDGAQVGYYPDTTALTVEQLQLNNAIKIFPNPANNIITIYAGNYTIESIKIADPAGRATFNLPRVNNRRVQVDVSQLSNGIYFAEIECAGAKINRRIAVSR